MSNEANEANDQKKKLLDLVRDALQHDQTLRDKYQIGDKFRFIRDRISALLSRTEEHLIVEVLAENKALSGAVHDEELVYVHLFNAQGLDIKTWQKMLNPSVFYEYSVNRPIYRDKSHIEAFIRSKANKAQHGYLTVAVKKEAIITTVKGEPAMDTIGHPLIKVKEGSLDAKRLISFIHNENEYTLSPEGVMIKKVKA
ncbi:MAG: hypothetical protein A3F14_03440 [Gammaproteobacteria bacterium RIFCSPHIGHO2_12_FULL_43_28]|nr:MAG: hypothetical protein A3F14_03440 [Gammaproteobacteria bacterium RIFCSPHIGHO2_12_FULL_43_28]